MNIPHWIKPDQLLSMAAAASAATGDFIVSNSKHLNDVVGTTQANKWMDAMWGIGHRIKHGHSLGDLPKVFEQFGMGGVVDYFEHMGRDFCTPHGLPVPYLDEIRKALDLKMFDAIDWGCLNVGDVLPGGLSAFGAVKSFKRIKGAEVIGRQDIAMQAASITMSLAMGTATTNPLLIAKVLFDVGMLAWSVGKSDDWQAFLNSQLVQGSSASISEFAKKLAEYVSANVGTWMPTAA